VNKERLLRLADLLDTIQPGRFDFGVWVSGPHDGDCYDLNHCGTVACALGWATTIPEFGLRFRWGSVSLVEDSFHDDGPFHAACHVFDIDMPTAKQIFANGDPEVDVQTYSAQHAAAHIRKVVAAHE
jgi:hypothetical protein